MAPPEALAAGWPAAVGLATALVVRRRRDRRRRARLEAAVHELRRPLQVLSLLPAGCERTRSRGCARAAIADLTGALTALGDLERAVLGSPPELRLRPVSLRTLVAAAIARCDLGWSEMEHAWSAGQAQVIADPARLGQALDNLLENTIEHGGPPIRISATLCASGVRLMIANGDRPGPTATARPGRGHGLRIVAAIASAHGGRFLFDRDAGTATAMLELPLARLPLPAACRADEDATAARAPLSAA